MVNSCSRQCFCSPFLRIGQHFDPGRTAPAPANVYVVYVCSSDRQVIACSTNEASMTCLGVYVSLNVLGCPAITRCRSSDYLIEHITAAREVLLVGAGV